MAFFIFAPPEGTECLTIISGANSLFWVFLRDSYWEGYLDLLLRWRFNFLKLCLNVHLSPLVFESWTAEAPTILFKDAIDKVERLFEIIGRPKFNDLVALFLAHDARGYFPVEVPFHNSPRIDNRVHDFPKDGVPFFNYR